MTTTFDGPVTPDLLKELQKGDDPYAFGYHPSGARASDFFAAPQTDKPSATPPSWYHPGYRKVPVRNQQGGTCVSNSCSTCMTLLEFVEKNDIINFDAEAWSGRAVAKEFGEGAAASPHDLLDDAMKHGVPAMEGMQQGLYFPKGYAWVDHNNPEAVREAMTTPGQVVTGAVWLQKNFGAGGPNPNFGDSSEPMGGKDFVPFVDEDPWGLHEITYVGYEPQGIVYQNSWGTWWGDGGFGRLSWDYLAKRTTEMLVITDNADNAGGYVKTFNYGNATETSIARFDLPDRKRPAVYLVKPNGRIWIQSPLEAKRFNVPMPPTRVPDTDTRWELPVIGLDAPRNLR